MKILPILTHLMRSEQWEQIKWELKRERSSNNNLKYE